MSSESPHIPYFMVPLELLRDFRRFGRSPTPNVLGEDGGLRRFNGKRGGQLNNSGGGIGSGKHPMMSSSHSCSQSLNVWGSKAQS